MSNDVHYRYPKAPQVVRAEITRVSTKFKNESLGVLASIILFIITYVVLVITGMAVAAACVFIGYLAVTAITSLWSLIFAIGMVVMAVFILVFLFKFIFKRTTVDQSGMREIKAAEHPQLFDFIQKVAAETQTPLPRKVFLSSDVNAFVFYNSTFWSMFLPVRKNLNIGLGLVNCVTISEFKAILAHEFGHFSQRSMKLHSYVYHVNHIIHNMLFDNQDYGRTLERFSNLTWIFSLVAQMTYSVIRAIQFVLEQVYSLVTRRSMALSRQMEFHADAVAASVSGSAPLARALYRLDFAQSCYYRVLETYNGWIGLNRKATNIFHDHTNLMQIMATEIGLRVEDGLVRLSADDVRKHLRTRVMVKDQWASHPTNEEREDQLNRLAIEAAEIEDSAWCLFSNATRLQQTVTDEIYARVKFTQTPELIDGDRFKSIFEENLRKYSFADAYKGFYDKRDFSVFDPHEVIQRSSPALATLDEILTPEILSLDTVISGLKSDLELLVEVQKKNSGIRTFDFDGKRYSRHQAPLIVEQLTKEHEEAVKRLTLTDQQIFALYHKHAVSAGLGVEAVAAYKAMSAEYSNQKKRIEELGFRLEECAQLYDPILTYEKASAVINNMLRVRKELRGGIESGLANPEFQLYLESHERQLLGEFIKDERDFLGKETINEEPVQLYLDALQIYQKVLSEHCFKLKKDFLDEQIRTIRMATTLVV